MIQAILILATVAAGALYLRRRLERSDGDYRFAEGGYCLPGKDWNNRDPMEPPTLH